MNTSGTGRNLYRSWGGTEETHGKGQAHELTGHAHWNRDRNLFKKQSDIQQAEAEGQRESDLT